MNTFKSKAKQCCSSEYERLVGELDSCEMASGSSSEKHNCYRRAAKESGRRAKACIAAISD